MKKNFFLMTYMVLIIGSLFLVPSIHFTVKASDQSSIIYEIAEDYVIITGTKLKRVEAIPEAIEGLPVVTLSEKSFFACINESETIHIPKSVKNIETLCFLGVNGDGIINYFIPSTVEKIGRYALGYTCYENYKDGCIIQDKIEKLRGVKIYGYTNTVAEEYAKENGFTFIPITDDVISGDVNGDGLFNVSDVVLLQKWLLSVPDTYLANWKAADFYEDGKLDVFDLCLMKRALIEGFKTDSVYTLTINGYKITESESGWMGEDYSSSITRNEIAQYPEIVSLLKKVSAKVTALKDTKILSCGFEISDYAEDNLYLSCNDGTGKENDILLCKIGSKCAWLDDSDVQELVTLLVESGLFSDKSIIQNYLKTK